MSTYHGEGNSKKVVYIHVCMILELCMKRIRKEQDSGKMLKSEKDCY